MTALIFFFTASILVILLIRLFVKLIRRKPVRNTLKLIGGIVLTYSTLWAVFDLMRKRVPVPMGTAICFDDWCATVNGASQSPAGDSLQVVLNITMSNHALGITQSPSEPRVQLLDASGKCWTYSFNAQRVYEIGHGVQPGISHQLKLHESLGTVLVFRVPKNTTSLSALIQEGPWITHLLFPENQMIFILTM